MRDCKKVYNYKHIQACYQNKMGKYAFDAKRQYFAIMTLNIFLVNYPLDNIPYLVQCESTFCLSYDKT